MDTMRLVFLGRPLFLLLVGVLLFSLGYSVAVAQNSGAITGTVKDDAGEPIPFANVAVEGTHFGAAGDAEGVYTIRNLPPGQYTLIASAVGFRRVQQAVSVAAGQTATQNFVLATDVLRMDAVVVTGTMTPRTKLESTVAISTLSPQDVFQASPRSTTEVLRYVPGFTRVESSGGEVNQNISVRGIMGVEYVMFMEDGLPVFPTMHTFFMNADNLFRPDENLRGVEVVRGGNSALFGSNTPGAIINFLNKTGGNEFAGSLKGTIGTEGLARYDFNFNGPLGQDWRFNFGGFYRYDDGVRYPGFPGIRGGQLKASTTRLLDNGFVRLSAKVIDDRNQFILPLPFQNPEDPEYVPGFSEYGAMNTNEANHLRVPTPAGELELPLDDGLRTKAYWLTTDVNLDFEGGWTVQNAAQIMQNDQGWNGIFTGQPLTGDEWFQSLGFPVGSTYQLFYTNHFDANGNRLPFNQNSNGGLGFVSPSQLVHVEKPMSAFQDQLQIRKKIGEHAISFGLYFANYTQTNRWYFTDILMDVRDNPRLLDLVVVAPPADTMQATQNGFRRFVSLYRNGSGSTSIFSGVFGGEFHLTEELQADFGFRYEHNNFVQSAENQTTVDLDGDPATTYDAVQWGDKSFRHFQRSMDNWALSVGLRYALSGEVSLYAQGNRAYKMPALDEFLDAGAQDAVDLFDARETVMLEGGVKYASPMLGFTLNGFWGQITNNVGQGFELQNGVGVWVIRTNPDSRSYGAELELSTSPLRGLHIVGAGTYTKAQTVEPGGSAFTAGGTPDFISNVSATYEVMDFMIKGDWHYVGTRDLVFAQYDQATRRYTEYRKFMELQAYSYLNLGASYTVPGQGVMLSLDVLNVTQSKGLEEGNPRLPGVKTFYFVARPILPRRLVFTVHYLF